MLEPVRAQALALCCVVGLGACHRPAVSAAPMGPPEADSQALGHEPDEGDGAAVEPSARVDLSDPGEVAPASPPEELHSSGVNAVGDLVGQNEYALQLEFVNGIPTLVRRRRPDVGNGLLTVITPVPDWNPNFGPGLGVTVKFLYKPLGRSDRSPPSSTTPFAIAWLRRSWSLGIDQRFYLLDDRWRLKLITHGGQYQLDYKRLGPTHNAIAYREDSFYVQALAWRQLIPHLYIGFGWGLRWAGYTGATPESVETLHEVNYGRDDTRSTGPVFDFLFDNRDDQFAPRRGHLANFGVEMFPTQLGSTSSHVRFNASYAGYASLSRPLVLAGRVHWGLAVGDAPLAGLPRYGGATDARGYQPGRFTGSQRLTGQLELRWTIKEPWGMVFFTEFGTIFDAPEDWRPDTPLDLLLPSGGFGLRYRPSPLSRLNFRADVVFARYNPIGLALGLGEAF